MKKQIAIPLMFVLIIFMFAVNNMTTKKLFESQPEWYFLNLNSYNKFLHIIGVGSGARALLADIEYINFLQYYGNMENMATGYKKLPELLNTITDADPHFTFAYTYGSAILAFNQKKYDEALTLINKGLEYNPKIWQLRLYLGAILYKEKGDMLKYIGILEDALRFEDHPAMIERILGNIYEETKTPDKAVKYWIDTYKNTKDKLTRIHAHARILAIIKAGKVKDVQGLLNQLN